MLRHLNLNQTEAPDLSEGVGHVVELRLHRAAVAVAALEGLEHGGDGERQQQEPDDDGDLRRFLQHFDEVPASQMHHVEVAVDGQRDEEGDAGPAVEEQHEEHGLAHGAVRAAPHVVAVVVGFDGEAGHQQEVCNHDVEEEDAFVLPELEPRDETDDLHEERKLRCSSSRFILNIYRICGRLFTHHDTIKYKRQEFSIDKLMHVL